MCMHDELEDIGYCGSVEVRGQLCEAGSEDRAQAYTANAALLGHRTSPLFVFSWTRVSASFSLPF